MRTGVMRRMSDYQIQLEPDLGVAEFIDILRRSTLAERRPVDDETVMAGMLRNRTRKERNYDVADLCKEADRLLPEISMLSVTSHDCAGCFDYYNTRWTSRIFATDRGRTKQSTQHRFHHGR